jgi:hypothetical protein
MKGSPAGAIATSPQFFDAVSNRAVAVRGEGGGWPQSAIPAEEEK